MTREALIQKLTTDLDAETDPVISPTEIAGIVDASRRYSVWVGATTVEVGDRIVPAVWNGRVYKAVTAGTTGDSAPSWPVSSYSSNGLVLTDGTVRWVDIGPAHGEQYDVRRAMREGCRLKARKCAVLVAQSIDGTSFQWQQRYEHWDREARRLAGFGAV